MSEAESVPGPTLIIGALRIDTASCQVSLDEHVISLCPQDYKLLAHLARNAGRVISKEELWREVWGDAENRTHNQIKSSVRRLRESIEPDPQKPGYILTVRRHGYLMPARPLMKDSSA